MRKKESARARSFSLSLSLVLARVPLTRRRAASSSLSTSSTVVRFQSLEELNIGVFLDTRNSCFDLYELQRIPADPKIFDNGDMDEERPVGASRTFKNIVRAKYSLPVPFIFLITITFVLRVFLEYFRKNSFDCWSALV